MINSDLIVKGLFTGLLPSLVDVVTDIFSFKHFVQGDFYTKTTHYNAEFTDENCTLKSNGLLERALLKKKLHTDINVSRLIQSLDMSVCL